LLIDKVARNFKMPVSDCQNSKLTLDTAKKGIFIERRMEATTWEIADTVDVSLTLINYYFHRKSLAGFAGTSGKNTSI
jgi:hypothetical protein